MRTQVTTLHHTGRKALHKIIAFFLIAGYIAVPAIAQENVFSGGSGTIDDPWHIETIEQLQHISEDLEAHYIFIQDIDASVTSGWNNGAGFEPIGHYDGTHAGAENEPFWGTLDGNGHIIDRLTINRPGEDGVGLFARTDEHAHIKHIQLTNVDIVGSSRTGALAGFNGGLIYNATVSGSVSGMSDIGLVTGVNALVIDQSQVNGEVFAQNRAGGTTGLNWGEIYDSESYAEVNVQLAEAGGMASVNSGLIRFSYASGKVTAGNNVSGGLVGSNNGDIQDSYATGAVQGVDQVGGLVGVNGPGNAIVNSHATGDVNGHVAVGGLVGYSDIYATIQVSYAEGNVTGEGAVGGLAGFLDGSVLNTYAHGNVTGGSEFGTGGLVGTFTPEGFSFFSMQPPETDVPEIQPLQEMGMQEEFEPDHESQFILFEKLINNSFATGQVSGQHNVGGLVGENSNNDAITSSYWNVQTTQQTSAVGAGDAGDAIGLQTSQMTGTSAETYLQGFEFNDSGGWETVSGSYPGLIPAEIVEDPPVSLDMQTQGFGDVGAEIIGALVGLNADDDAVFMNRTTWFGLESEGDARFYDNNGSEIQRIPIQRNQVIQYFSYVSNSGGLQEVTVSFLTGQPTLEGVQATAEINILDDVEDFIITGIPLIQVGQVSAAPYMLTIRNEEGYRSAPEEATTFSLSSTGEASFYSQEEAGFENEITSLTVGADETETVFWYRNNEEGTHTIIAEFSEGDQALSGKTAEFEVIAMYQQDDKLLASPNQATNNGTTTVMIYGSDFEEGTEIQLVHDSYETIFGTVLDIVDDGTIRVRFNVSGQPEGERHLRVTYPDGSVVESMQAFTITSGDDQIPQLWTHIQGRPQLEPGKTARININYGNSGSVDLYDMLLYIYLPADLEFEIIESSFIRPEMADMKASADYDGPEDLSTVTPYYELEDKTVIPLWIYQLPAGSSQSVELKIKVPDTGIEQSFSDIFGRSIETEIAALPPEASPFTLTGDFDAHEPNMLIHFGTLIYVAALQEEGLIDSNAPYLKQAMNLSEVAGNPCNPGPPPPDLYTSNQNLQDEIQNHRRGVANQMREEATSLAPTPFSYGAGAAVGIAAGVACASTPIGWGTCTAIAVGSGALTLSGFTGLFNRHDDLNNDECNMPEGPDNYDPNSCGACGGDGGGYGDPHLFTFDGLNYSFQAAGEFVLTRSVIDDFEIQARMEQMEPDIDHFTIFTAFALHVNGEQIVILEDDSPPYIPSLKINGTAQDLTEIGAEPLALPAGGTIRWIGNTFIIQWPDSNTEVHAWQSPSGMVTGNRALAIEIMLGENYSGQMEGLLGSFDSQLRNVFKARDGRRFLMPLSYDELYEEFGNSWRINQRESLFGTETFKVSGIPSQQMSTRDLDNSSREEAQQLCEDRGITNPVILDNCIFDVAMSGDDRFADDAASLITSTPNEQMNEFLAENEGKIQIDLHASGTASASFEFHGDNPDIGTFSLSESETGEMSDTRVFYPLNPGTYQVSLESPLDQFELVDIVCEHGETEINRQEQSAFITLEGGEAIRCSFSIIPENMLRRFALHTPDDQRQVEIEGVDDDEFVFSWESAAVSEQDPVEYFLVLDSDEHFRNPFFEGPSKGSGTETSSSLTYEQMDQFLEELQVDQGASFIGYWTVRAKYDGVTRQAENAHRITFHRGVVVGTSLESPLPTEFILEQNYPNPFNPSTIITYKLPESTHVRLSVYNIIGQRVSTLVDSRITAGTHHVQFDASGLASGTYIYRIEAGRFVETGTMMFIK